MNIVHPFSAVLRSYWMISFFHVPSILTERGINEQYCSAEVNGCQVLLPISLKQGNAITQVAHCMCICINYYKKSEKGNALESYPNI